MSILKRICVPGRRLAISRSLSLVILMCSTVYAAPQDEALRPMSSEVSRDQLRQLVAPIALYPDALVAQILAAAVYPDQIAQAERFLQQHPELKGQALAATVDQQTWDPSVKALTQFPTVLANMARNLAWASALGDTYMNQPDDVMNTIQDLRRKAKVAGALRSNSQLQVETEGDTIVINSANPEVVYVPTYDPEVVFGVGLWPGLVPWWVPGTAISFSVGFFVGPFIGFSWGWPAWAFDWHHHALLFARAPYVFGHPVFYKRGAFFRPAPFYPRGAPYVRGYAPRVVHSGRPLAVRPAIVARGYAARGRASLHR
jgi:uncharacterized protein DUF3300